MKVFIIHDEKGKIRGAIIPTSKIANSGVKPAKGLHVHKIDIDELKEEERKNYLVDLYENHSINLSSSEPSLIKK